MAETALTLAECRHGHPALAVELGVQCPQCIEEAKAMEEEAQRLAYREKCEKERQAWLAKVTPIWKAITDEVNKRQPDSAVLDGTHLRINGIQVQYEVDIREEHKKTSRWNSVATGKLRLMVGHHGCRTMYPQRKDGSFNYPDIASFLINYAAREISKKKLAEVQKANQEPVEQLAKELHVSQYYGGFRVQPSGHPDAPAFVTISCQRAMTVDEARALHAKLVELGVVERAK